MPLNVGIRLEINRNCYGISLHLTSLRNFYLHILTALTDFIFSFLITSGRNIIKLLDTPQIVVGSYLLTFCREAKWGCMHLQLGA